MHDRLPEVRGDLRIVPSPPAPEAPDARVGFVSPGEDERFLEGDPVEVRLRLSGYRLGVPTPGGDERGILRDRRGQHLHLILNDEPYRALHELDDPLVLQDLPPGTHVLRVLAGTDWHESVKTPGAFAVRTIHVDPADPAAPGDGTGASGVRAPNARPPDGPLLTLSRPAGTYVGAEADSVLVDFHLAGVRLEPGGYRVRLRIEGIGEAILVHWAPYLLLGLPDGEHVVRLELLDPAGAPLPGPFVRSERTIRVTRTGR
jgi:hypothetical protein